MTKSVFEQFQNATRDMGVHVILQRDSIVGKIVTKWTPSTCRVFIQLDGLPMVSGKASGGGYDKQAAAMRDALDKLRLCPALDTSRYIDSSAARFALCDHAAIFDSGFDYATRRISTETGTRIIEVV